MLRIAMREGTKYKHNNTGKVSTLHEDYNGSWYISRRDEEGHTKSLSYSKTEMKNTLKEHYKRVE